MIFRAPGKVVISGSYAVLEGAPAVVSAVDRYVTCDASRTADWTTPEVRAAIGDAPAPHFDASALRERGRKLGLGSSAAILTASLAALNPSWLAETAGQRRLLSTALVAHRTAQGGGSGIDVLASVEGGVQRARLCEGQLEHRRVTLPPDVEVEVWASPSAASTAQMLRAVEQLKRDAPARYALRVDALSQAAEATAAAIDDARADELIAMLSAQQRALSELGRAAGIDIVTDAVRELTDRAQAAGAAVIVSGAGGGDIVLWVGREASDAAFRARAATLAHQRLALGLGARGVHQL